MEPALNPHDNRQINHTLNWLLELDRKMVGSSSSSSSFTEPSLSFDSEYEDAVDQSASQWDAIDQSVDDTHDLLEATLAETIDLFTENVKAALITYPWSETKPTTFYEGSGEETTSPYTPFISDEFDQIMVNLDEDYEATLGQHFPVLLATVEDLMTMPTEMTSSESSGWFMSTLMPTSTLMTTTTDTTTTETTTTEGTTTTETTTVGTTMTQSTTVPLTEIVRECDDQDLCDYEGSSEPGDGDDEMVKTRISALYHNLICQFFTRS